MLDKDFLSISGDNKDIFVAIQPHSIMGRIYSTISKNNQIIDTIQHSVGDRFYVRNQDLLLNYTYRGGCVVHTWVLPHGMCDPDYTIYSSGQRYAKIEINEKFEENSKICWLLDFNKPVDFDASFNDGSSDSKLIIGDSKHLITKHFYEFRPKQKRTNLGLNRTHLVLLEASQGHVSLEIEFRSDIPYADWTDKPSLFVQRGKSSENNQKPMYLHTVRDVKLWIWALLFAMIGSIFGFTLIIFFVRPFKKIHRSLSQQDLTKAAKTKSE